MLGVLFTALLQNTIFPELTHVPLPQQKTCLANLFATQCLQYPSFVFMESTFSASTLACAAVPAACSARDLTARSRSLCRADFVHSG